MCIASLAMERTGGITQFQDGLLKSISLSTAGVK